MMDSDMYPTFLKLEPKEETKLEPFDLESNGRSPRSNCSSLNDQFGVLLTGFPSKLDEEVGIGLEGIKMVFEVEESETNLTLVKREVGNNSDMLEQNISGSGNFSKNFQCGICNFRTIKKVYLKRHMIIHKDPSEIKMFKCLSCPYESKRKRDLKVHMLIHKDPDHLKRFQSHLETHNLQQDQYSESEAKPFQCPECSYKAKLKSRLDRHSSVHNSLMYKCSCCDFKSKRKDNLKLHMNRHQDISEIRMFKCELCHYENRYKRNLKRHVLVYHNSSASVYKCKSCNYTTNDSYSFRCHAISHRDKPEVKSFESNGRSQISNSLINQFGDPLTGLCSKSNEEKKMKMEFEIEQSEIQLTVIKEEVEDNNDMPEENIPGSANLKCSKKMSKNFQCHICGFETIKSIYLKNHMISHKAPSEIKVFKCFNCSYETKRKGNLVDHMVIHKNPGDVKMFKCPNCPYESKRKGNLVEHMITHKSPGDIKMFKCLSCPYETKIKSNLIKHMIIHKDPGDVEMFKCLSCPYEAKRKTNLMEHMFRHDHDDIKMFECDICPYESKGKCTHLNTHNLLQNQTQDRHSASGSKPFQCPE